LQFFELLQMLTLIADMKHMFSQDFSLIGFDFRLVALSGLALAIATCATLGFTKQIRSSQGLAWFAWLIGGACTMGTGIWLTHYLGLKALSLPVPMLNDLAVRLSMLATIFASGFTLLVVSGRSDPGRHVKEKRERVSVDPALLRT
jgi:NO-binding membrane sensor protein with MHYT domain